MLVIAASRGEHRVLQRKQSLTLFRPQERPRMEEVLRKRWAPAGEGGDSTWVPRRIICSQNVRVLLIRDCNTELN